MNEKYLGGPSPDRLIVARLMPTYVPLPSIEPVVRKEKPETQLASKAQIPEKIDPSPKGEAAVGKQKIETQVASRAQIPDSIKHIAKEESRPKTTAPPTLA
jgi:hypothetical protein